MRSTNVELPWLKWLLAVPLAAATWNVAVAVC
jgi:hypothetical protein